MYVDTLAVVSGPNLAHLRYCEANKLEDKTVKGLTRMFAVMQYWTQLRKDIDDMNGTS